MPTNLLPFPSRTRTRESSRELAAERLREALADSGLSQDRAAELLGVDSRQVRRWLHGEVALGPLELLVELEAVTEKRRAA